MFKKNQENFNLLFEAVSEGVIVVDENQIIVAVNSSTESMFGYQKDTLINESLQILIPSKYHHNHGSHFSDFIKKSSRRKMGRGRDLYGITKNKKEFPLEVGLNPFNMNGKTYIMALIIDISVRKETEKEIDMLNSQLEKKIKERTSELNKNIIQLKDLNLNFEEEIKKRVAVEKKLKVALKKEIELNDLKTKFLSLVSHEFKTPLSGILTSTILLEKYKLSEQQDKRDKHLKTITNKVHYLNNILNDFLSIERLDSGKINYKFTTFNLSKVINEVIYNSNMLLKSGQRIKIPYNIDEHILRQDEKILELALSNLIHNAIKYSSENTDINFEIKRKGKNIIFKVTDQGIGIPEKDQKHLFKRYFRAENVLTYPGTGIGLNIAKVHLRNIGGKIKFTSEENRGSTFIIKLPITKE
ncbi:MAG: PAS domain-containing sensor histidine kinase [Aureibaculum sp.]|nr:PAS domain-containing sensor histidine kinase [Aureibaculum sp.]